MPYLTPDTPPDETVCFTLRVPNDVAWIGIVKGAVSELIKAYNFEGFGTATPAETAARFLDMYDEFVFSECDMACCYDTVDRRVTSDGELEISINGGEWQQDPNDPRLTGTSLPPPALDETHTKCDAATNGLQHFEDLIAAHSNDLETATTAFELLGLIALEIAALLFAPGAAPLIVPILIGTVIALFAFGKTAFDAYWVTDRYDEVLCALYCTIGEDGQFTDEQFTAFLAKYGTDLPASVAKDMLYRDMQAAGRKGLNNMCAYGSSSEADCSSCGCGGCVADFWGVGVWLGSALSTNAGVVVERGDCYIIVDSEDRGDGVQAAIITLIASDTEHCSFHDTELISGTTPSEDVRIACGTDRIYTNLATSGYGSGPWNSMGYNGTGAFRMKFNLTVE